MSNERISVNISAEVSKLGELLKSAGADRKLLLRLLRQPSAELTRAGIAIEKYGTTAQEKERIIRQVDSIITSIVTGEVKVRLGQLVASTMTHAHTEATTEYNFNHSSITETSFEPHVSTVRGTSSHASTGESVSVDAAFAGLSLQGLEERLVGPLISERAIETMKVAFEKTVTGVRR